MVSTSQNTDVVMGVVSQQELQRAKLLNTFAKNTSLLSFPVANLK